MVPDERIDDDQLGGARLGGPVPSHWPVDGRWRVAPRLQQLWGTRVQVRVMDRDDRISVIEVSVAGASPQEVLFARGRVTACLRDDPEWDMPSPPSPTSVVYRKGHSRLLIRLTTRGEPVRGALCLRLERVHASHPPRQRRMEEAHVAHRQIATRLLDSIFGAR